MNLKNVLAIGLGLAGLISIRAATNSASPVRPEPTKPCFQCSGSGKTRCPVATCKNGEADCPGPCLKLSKGSWIHLDVAGHGPTELWQKFYKADGRNYAAWNQNHIGEVIQIQNGEPVNIGKCTVCGGTTRTKCAVCKGSGEVTCSLCDGK